VSTKPPILGNPLPPQVPLFKSTQYFANVLELADLIAALIYEQLPSKSFTLRSGDTIGTVTGFSELSIATFWDHQYQDLLTNPDAKLSLFWQTIYDYVNGSVHDSNTTAQALLLIHLYLDKVVQDANGDTKYPVIYQLQLAITAGYLPKGSPLRSDLTFDQLISLLNFLHSFSQTLDTVLDFKIPKLSYEVPLDDKPTGWKLDVEAAIELQLPATSDKFLTWLIQDKGFSLYLHLDSIAVTDPDGLALISYDKTKDKNDRFVFGADQGVVFKGVKITLDISGELAKADKQPMAPYHKLRQAYFTERDHDNLVDIALTIDSVKLNLTDPVLSAVFSVLDWAYTAVAKETLEDAIQNGFEAMHDFGAIGETIKDSVFTPLLPGAIALETHDLYRPFVKEHSTFSYDKLFIGSSGRGINIRNNPPEPGTTDNGNGGIHYPPTDGVPDPPLYGHADPIPDSGGTAPRSPFDDLILTEPRRSELKSKLDTMTGLVPEQEAAARLWLDGFPPRSMAWLQDEDVDSKAGTVYGKPASPKTIASLGRLLNGNGNHQTSFVFSSASAVRPAAGTMLATAAAPLQGSMAPPDLHPVPAPTPVSYAAESTLASSKGSKIDPFWAGISINAVAIQNIYLMLNDSDAFVRSGAVKDLGPDVPFKIASKTSPSISIDLSGKEDHRPVATIKGLVVKLGDQAQATYQLECTSPLEVVKFDPKCLPDDTLSTIAFNRSCIEGMADSQFTDQAYLDLLYRYFCCLQFVSDEAVVTTSTLTDGKPIHQPPPQNDPGKKPGPPDPTGGRPDPPVIPPVLPTDDSVLLLEALKSTLSQVPAIPVAFDPYYGQATKLQDFEAKDGWLNIYETYQGFTQS